MTDKDVARKRKRFYDALSAAAALKISFESLSRAGIGDFFHLGLAFERSTRETLKRELIESWDEWQYAKAYVDVKAEGHDHDYAHAYAEATAIVLPYEWEAVGVTLRQSAEWLRGVAVAQYVRAYVDAKAEGYDDNEARLRAKNMTHRYVEAYASASVRAVPEVYKEVYESCGYIDITEQDFIPLYAEVYATAIVVNEYGEDEAWEYAKRYAEVYATAIRNGYGEDEARKYAEAYIEAEAYADATVAKKYGEDLDDALHDEAMDYAAAYADAYADVRAKKKYREDEARKYAEAYAEAYADAMVNKEAGREVAWWEYVRAYAEAYADVMVATMWGEDEARKYAEAYVREKSEGHDDSEAQRRAEERINE